MGKDITLKGIRKELMKQVAELPNSEKRLIVAMDAINELRKTLFILVLLLEKLITEEMENVKKGNRGIVSANANKNSGNGGEPLAEQE